MAARRTKTRSALQNIQLQVMWNRLISVVEEQAQTLVRTAFGAATREAGDLFIPRDGCPHSLYLIC